jgi:hypothetical protein
MCLKALETSPCLGLKCANVSCGRYFMAAPQFIEDMQQSRAFHETCELKLPEGQAAKIPEVRSSYWYTCSVMLLLAVPSRSRKLL